MATDAAAQITRVPQVVSHDRLAIPDNTRAKRIGLLHGVGNVVVVLLFAVSWLIRAAGVSWDANRAAVTLGIVGLLVACVTGWLGGELVERLGVSVDPDANLDAPSSLRRTTHGPRGSMRLGSEQRS